MIQIIFATLLSLQLALCQYGYPNYGLENSGYYPSYSSYYYSSPQYRSGYNPYNAQPYYSQPYNSQTYYSQQQLYPYTYSYSSYPSYQPYVFSLFPTRKSGHPDRYGGNAGYDWRCFPNKC